MIRTELDLCIVVKNMFNTCTFQGRVSAYDSRQSKLGHNSGTIQSIVTSPEQKPKKFVRFFWQIKGHNSRMQKSVKSSNINLTYDLWYIVLDLINKFQMICVRGTEKLGSISRSRGITLERKKCYSLKVNLLPH